MASSAYKRGFSVLIVTDRIELLKQSGGALNRLGVNPYQIRAGHEPATLTGQVYTAMVETLARRMKDARYQRLVAGFDLIIFDEAHKQAFNKLFRYISDNTIVIGATATPWRQRNQKALSEFYQDIIEVIDIPTLIRQGFLSKPLSYGIPVDLSQVKMRGGDFDERSMGEQYSRNKVYRGVIENYQRLTPGKKALSFSSSIESSQELTQRMVEAGINAKHLDSNMRPYERTKVLAWFDRTPDAVLNNVGILTTGFDCPAIEAVILYRATTSLPLFLQMVGRGSRVIPGVKDTFHILDFGENIQRHGFWEQPREWSLEKAKKKRKTEAAPVKSCPECEALLHTAARSCSYCGHEFGFTKEEEDAEVVAQLQLLTPRDRRAVALQSTLEEKVMMAKNKLIKPYWVLHTMKSMEEAREFTRLMGWKPGWWHHNKHRFPNLKREKV
jgi:superfamily II DNA or RNA helicase